MSGTPSVSLVCCDLASIVIERSVLERAFAEAIATEGVVTGTEAYVRAMVRFDRAKGRPPADVMREIFADESRVQVAIMAFERSFRAAAERFGVAASPGIVSALAKTAASGAKICLMTTLSRAACGAVLDELTRQGLADLTLCADDVPRGFPWPDLVLTAMRRLGVGHAGEVAVISATVNGLESGHRAGAAIVACVGGGWADSAAMNRAGVTHVLDSIDLLPDLLAY